MPRTGRPKRSKDTECTCRQCGRAYVVPEWKKYGREFCTRDCWYAYRRENKIGRIDQFEPTVLVCPRCETEFLAGGRGRPRLTATYCSQACSAAALGYQSWPREMSDLERAWLAGVFDGEGSIVRTKPGRACFRISIPNTCFALLEQVLCVTGTGALHHQPVYKDHHSPIKVWQCHSTNAAEVLRQILPWLIVKKEKAEAILLQFAA